MALSRPHPRKVRNREVRLHPHHRRPLRRQHINPMPRRREQVTVPTNLDAIRHIFHGLVNRPLVQEMFSRGVQVEGVDRARFRRVPVDARCGDKRGDGDFAGASVRYVEGALVGGEGDAVGLLEGVFHERWLACLRVEAEGPGSHLRRLGVDGIAAAVVFLPISA